MFWFVFASTFPKQKMTFSFLVIKVMWNYRDSNLGFTTMFKERLKKINIGVVGLRHCKG
jgi:hypothetical protein